MTKVQIEILHEPEQNRTTFFVKGDYPVLDVMQALENVSRQVLQSIIEYGKKVNPEGWEKLTPVQILETLKNVPLNQIMEGQQVMCMCPECQAVRNAGPMSKGGEA